MSCFRKLTSTLRKEVLWVCLKNECHETDVSEKTDFLNLQKIAVGRLLSLSQCAK